MGGVRKAGIRQTPQAVTKALDGAQRKTINGLMWGMRMNSSGWTLKQTSIGYLRMSKLTHLPAAPFAQTAAG